MFFIACCGATPRHDDIIDEKWRPFFAFFQRWHNSAYNFDAVGVVVVVEALTEEESVSVMDWLGFKEVVLLKCNAAVEIVNDVVLGLGEHDWGYVLHDETQRRVLLSASMVG